MADIPRIDVDTARRKVRDGQALLVCAYEDPARCRSMALEGSLDLQAFQAQLPSLSPERELIFYCA